MHGGMAIQHRSCWRRSRQKSHVLTVEFIDRAPTVRFYDHTGHMSAAVCCETSLHALTDGRRHDHREGCEDAISRGWEGVKGSRDAWVPPRPCLLCVERRGIRLPFRPSARS